MHDDEIDVSVDLVTRLLAAQFPEWAGLPVRPVPSAGTVNALFRLGSGMVARFPRVEWGVADITKEYRWLPRLAPLLPVAVPEPLAMGAPGEGYPWEWSVYRWLEGENPSPDRSAHRRGIATDLARFIAALRQVDATDAPPGYRGALSPRDAATCKAIEESRGLIEGRAVTRAWEVALEVPDYAGPPVWVHSDLLPGNLLTVGDRLSAVIDFAAAGAGDPACDLIPAWSLLNAQGRAAFREALAADEASWARGRGWALSIALIALPYYQQSNPVFAAIAAYTIEEVLSDHS
jgi:aminoglycoside phosphotransferase (APT) family kinase protein